MSLEVLYAYIKGYSDRLLDQQIIAVTTGYWSGYYSNAKHAIKVSKVISNLYKNHRSDKRRKPHADTVDVDAFLDRETAFYKKLKKGGNDIDGE